ncbi:Uncharacterised protein [Streptococcus pneumoniae]|nr:Uncharacterised protein [Streptococcus pneumoniae]
MSSAVLFFGSIALFYFLVMIPIQYLYLQGLHEKKEKTGLSQRELYEKMSFGEEQLHFHVQGNPFNIPSAFVATTGILTLLINSGSFSCKSNSS